MLVDAAKALSLVEMMPTKKDNNQAAGLKPSDLRLISIAFHGASKLRLPLQQQSQAHADMFLRSARWFVNQQNEHGGWSVPVERAIADNRLVLKAGWHSAMAQGHALSVLTRAYHVTQEEKYLKAAERALELFKKPASEGGVTNRLFERDWYEEYPTTPGSFVLNGFLYSLIGLHDASALPALHNESSTLFAAGLRSLVALLPLYDTGSGSVYDLRHLGLKTAPNLARWDYHAVHVYLLKWLFNITGDRSLNEVADRWIGYAHGKRAKHN
ncbi:D-glucuronyl C5 epimerase [Aphelenchoides avenae]|nr:D-glucuronyl C5 epimerase [Aphelenchus avenae]